MENQTLINDELIRLEVVKDFQMVLLKREFKLLKKLKKLGYKPK